MSRLGTARQSSEQVSLSASYSGLRGLLPNSAFMHESAVIASPDHTRVLVPVASGQSKRLRNVSDGLPRTENVVRQQSLRRSVNRGPHLPAWLARKRPR